MHTISEPDKFEELKLVVQILQATSVIIFGAPDVIRALPTYWSRVQDDDYGIHWRFISVANRVYVGRVYHPTASHQELVDLGLLDFPTCLR